MAFQRPDADLLKKYPNAVTAQQLEAKSRFLGTLLGLAAGESLGAGFEFKRAGTFPPPREILGGGPWLPGEPTDDVELTLALLRVVARGKVDLDAVAKGYLKFLNSNPKDIGNLTQQSLLNLRAGEGPAQSGALSWEDSGRKSAGNGSVMCCAPIGLLHAHHPEGLVEDATAVSRITHYDPRCVGGCVAVCTAIGSLVRGEFDTAIADAAEAGGQIHDEVRMVIERGAAKRPEQLTVDGSNMGYVLIALEICFSALASAESLEEGLVAVVARGGDTDTNGAIAGALLGARFGKGAVPERWEKKLKAWPELLSLGEQLYKVAG
jgi:ADP-ribosyl-[dinitrogen reductase] hydrolase